MTRADSASRSRGLGFTRDLTDCPVKNGFRLRGIDMTRIEAFTDAAFAFALTLLVVAGDDVPTNHGELVDAMRGVPAFLLSFVLFLMFWGGHWRWSRRFGLEDFPSIALSFLLVFVVLCYVYPLRYMFGLFMNYFSGGALSPDATLDNAAQLHGIFAIYGVGFTAMCGAVLLLNLHAWRRRDALQLDVRERHDTVTELQSWAILASTGVASTLLTLLPYSPFMPMGWVYMLLAIAMPIHSLRRDRSRARLAPAPGV